MLKKFKDPWSGPNEKLDIFWGPEGPANTKPIFVYFSGGYWQAGCGDNSAYAVSPLHNEGINCVIVDYPRAPGKALCIRLTIIVQIDCTYLVIALVFKKVNKIMVSN